MLFYYINNSDRSADVVANTLRIENQIQQRSDSCSFKVFQNTKPTENQSLQLFDGGLVSTQVGATIVLKETYQTDVLAFRQGQVIWLKIGDSTTERGTISTYTESTRTIVLTAAPSIALSADDKVGEKIFGGTVSRVKDLNIRTLDNIEYEITGVDYTKIFDKKIVSDTWEDVDSRYIINNFVNTTVNYNSTLDDIDYDDNAAIQAEWIDGGDGNNPTVDSSDFMEGDAAGVFGWTNAGGTATWDATPTSKDLSDFFGVANGQPTEGRFMGWFKTSNQSDITTLSVRIGSAAGHYGEFTITLTDSTDWQYVEVKGVDASITGTPDWTATDYAQLRGVETGNGSIKWNGLRINAENSFTLFNVQSTLEFDDLRSPQLKPTILINLMAKTWEYVWYVDYERDIHFVDKENDPSPFQLTDTSNNFIDLKVGVDASNLGNRIIIRGGEKTSDSTYAQIIDGTGEKREWILKNKFNNLVITLDDNSSTDLMEVGTTTTNVTATGHGLVSGDHMVNRTRNNAVREITKVDNNNFTVGTVAAQANGDTFSKFDTAKTDGVEGITDESTVDYVANSNEKSIRATDSEATLTSGNFLRFAYNERLPIQIQYTDSASANALKALGLGDGIFDLDPVTDRNIKDIGTAIAVAEAKVLEFSNAIITGTFITDQKGLKAGQILHITESTNRSLDDDFVIQQIIKKQAEGRFKDNLTQKVTFGTTLFGWIEFMQKLLKTKDGIELNVDDIVETFATSDEIVECVESNTAQTGGILSAIGAETVETSETNTIHETTVPWQYETSAGQSVATRYDLSEYS